MSNSKEHIVDSFGRVHDYLRISLTERCNLRCFYCMPEEGVQLKEKEKFMTSEELISIAKQFVEMGVKKIRLTGGEPLIKKDAEVIIRALGELPIELTLTTNAVTVDRFIDVFKEAGIRSVNVSLDSLVEERFNKISRRNYFSKIMENIDLLIANQFHVKVNVVVIKGVNDDEIIDFVRWTKTKDVHVRFIEFMPFDGNNWNWEKKVSFNQIMEEVKTEFGDAAVEKLQDKKNDTSRSFRLVDAVGTFGIISTVTNPFCDTCNRIRLTADGKVKNCLFSDDETNILEALRAGGAIEPLIRKSITAKHKERAGLPDFTDETMRSHKNRSMITIGG